MSCAAALKYVLRVAEARANGHQHAKEILQAVSTVRSSFSNFPALTADNCNAPRGGSGACAPDRSDRCGVSASPVAHSFSQNKSVDTTPPAGNVGPQSSGESQQEALITECAWCVKERGVAPTPGASHGICGRHQAEMLRELVLLKSQEVCA